MATAIDFQALMSKEKRRLSIKKKNITYGAPSSVLSELQSGTKVLKEFRVLGKNQHLQNVFYIPNYVSISEGESLVSRIDEELPSDMWTNLGGRSLQNLGGIPHPEGMHPEELPPCMQDTLQQITLSGIFPVGREPNHILLNSYSRGQGISGHQDGPLYSPTVAILTLSGPSMLQFWDDRSAALEWEPPAASIMCMPNSLVIFEEEAYSAYWHGISKTNFDTLAEHTMNLAALPGDPKMGDRVHRAGRRISLTMRHVACVKSEDALLLTAEAKGELRRRLDWWHSGIGD
jgi:alkylated DNA repair protein alkB family protein 6